MCLSAAPLTWSMRLSLTAGAPRPLFETYKSQHMATSQLIPPLAAYPVTDNLYNALVHLREVDKPRTLWADAVCINQSDPQEHAEQVTRMQNVYARASKVIVWLGADSEDDMNAKHHFAIARHIAQRFSESAGEESFGWSYKHFEDIYRDSRHAPYTGTREPVYRAEFPVFQNPWFQRTWVFQEAFNARSVLVQCGSETFPCHHPSFMTTSEGDIGLCPPMAKQGDTVVVLLGGKVPYLIRNTVKTDRHGRHYAFIGECFLYRYMDGLAVRQLLDSKHSRTEKIFELR